MEINGKNLNIEKLWQMVHFSNEPSKSSPLSLCPKAREKVTFSREYVERELKNGKAIYGLNTGFGALSQVPIPKKDHSSLQVNLLRSHCSGVGDPLTWEQSRAALILRANALASGHSGIRALVIDKILEFFNAQLCPYIPKQGSVGASGDLAPLAHLAITLIGEGAFLCKEQKQIEGKEETEETQNPFYVPKPCALILAQKGLKPLEELKAKEGLSLINGCQITNAIAMLCAFQCRDLLILSDAAGALTLEVLKGSRSPFDPLISATRPHPGEIQTAYNLRQLLQSSSPIAKSHENCNRVQDAYSLRCMPQVHGAAKGQMEYSIGILEREANSSTDNPLVFATEKKILSCGNFHGEPLALALDGMALALQSLANISERRLAQLMNPSSSSGLPLFLAPEAGLHSGHMMLQVTAAALVSENKILCHPASVDSIPTSADKEDHVSMSTLSAQKLEKILANTQQVIAIEMLSAAQALDLLRPLKTSPPLEKLHQHLREHISFAKKDRIFAEDAKKMVQLIRSKNLCQTLQAEVPTLRYF